MSEINGHQFTLTFVSCQTQPKLEKSDKDSYITFYLVLKLKIQHLTGQKTINLVTILMYTFKLVQLLSH